MFSSVVRAAVRPLVRAVSSAQDVKTLGVVGVGQMGAGIAQVAAQVAKLQVLLMDGDRNKLEKSLKNIGMLK